MGATKQRIKVLLVDDHPVVRKGLQSCLARQDTIKVVGEASDGDEALRKAREVSPDVVLMDISMPRMNGLAVTETLRKESPNVKVLILSVHSNKEYIFRVIQAGAHGYVSKVVIGPDGRRRLVGRAGVTSAKLPPADGETSAAESTALRASIAIPFDDPRQTHRLAIGESILFTTWAIAPSGLRTATAQLDGERIITPSRTAWPPMLLIAC